MKWIYEKDRIQLNDEDGNLMAEVIFTEKQNDEIDIEHVYVDSALRGQGVAGKMMEAVVNYLRAHNKKATATCAYANSWLQKNKEVYGDIISTDFNDVAACRIENKH